MKRVGLVVAYDGTKYSGWQTQPNGITIQGVLNDTLSELLGEKIETIGASRTDAGVHALGNVAVFDTESRIPGEKFSYALNQRLPEDIRIQLSEEVEPDFHPRYCDSEKTYEYRILNRKFPVPTERLYSYFYHYKLDVDKMKEATSYLIGRHDFARSLARRNAEINSGTRRGTIFFAFWIRFPFSKSAPLAICAFMILSVSSRRIGIKRRAMDIIMAISCTGTRILFSGRSSLSRPSVS